MLFTPENCEKVLAGTKTMTRRVCHVEHFAIEDYAPFRIVAIGVLMETPHADGEDTRILYEVGKDYAVQPGRGKKAVGRIKIAEIRREKVQEISTEDCVREGADGSVGASGPGFHFKTIWDGLYGNDPVKGWEANPEVWVISFELVQ